MSSTGTGQTIALVEDGLVPDMLETLHWRSQAGVPVPRLTATKRGIPAATPR
jgi:hypothetical protein